jgi:hypothetical protein
MGSGQEKPNGIEPTGLCESIFACNPTAARYYWPAMQLRPNRFFTNPAGDSEAFAFEQYWLGYYFFVDS